MTEKEQPGHEIMDAWKSIDTAPRDGTMIIVWDNSRQCAISACWHTEPERDDPTSGHEPAWSGWVSPDDIILWDDGTEPTSWLCTVTEPRE